MRRAFTLIELLVVVAVLPFVMITISGVFATFIRDLPQTTRILQENTTVLDVLGQIRRDVDGAIGLPRQFEGQHADERTLLIAQDGRVIRYQIEEGRIVRTPWVVTPSDVSSSPASDQQRATSDEIDTPQTALSSEERLWRVKDAVITWRLWMDEDRAYAVEIHSHVKQRVAGHLREKLANSQVFFLHGSGPMNHRQDADATESRGQDALATGGMLHDLGTLARKGQGR